MADVNESHEVGLVVESSYSMEVEDLNVDAFVKAVCNEYKEDDLDCVALATYAKDRTIVNCLLGRQVCGRKEAYTMYRTHAHAVGFSVRKGVTKFIEGTRQPKEFNFCCSCQGWSDHDKVSMKKEADGKIVDAADLVIENAVEEEIVVKKRKKRSVNITRCGCLAKIRYKLDKTTGFFVVVDHKLHHNHALANRYEAHYLKSNRSISSGVGSFIMSMSDAGIKPMDSYNYMCIEAGGEQNVGHLKKDHLNFLNRMRCVEGGDMQSVLDLLYEKSSSDSTFFYRFKVDDDNHVSCLFWRDSMMLEDYKAFGDLLITDTTYRTNKYNLICAPFVGINNHWRTVMFGCAFITNETNDTFVWLLETFKKSMQGHEPKSIFTDQDAALSFAIDKVFPNSRHRLCLWHL